MKKRDYRLYQKPKTFQFTKEGLEELKQTYEALKKERPLAVEHLKKSRELGDLSENGYYKASRQRLSYIDSQLVKLGRLLKYGKIQRTRTSGAIGFGSKVTLFQKSEKATYTIVGEFEADPEKKRISAVSPLGKSLLGKKVGEKVVVLTPQGEVTYLILHVV